MLNKKLHNYLYFTRKEKNGIIAILVGVVIFLIAPFLYPLFFKEKDNLPADYTAIADSLKMQAPGAQNKYEENNYPDYSSKNYSSYNKNFQTPLKGELFYFDPNTLSVDGWVRLGVKEKIANNIHKYLSKGGKFKEPADMKKIWGLQPALLERIIPYIKIAQNNSSPQFEKNIYPAYEKKVFEKKILSPIDINSADSTRYDNLPGIGPSFAKRIINFRTRLGGFYSVNQVSETFGLPDSTFQKIKPYLQIDQSAVKKININTATQDELKAHPYIRYQLANIILQYRNQHGGFKNIEDIKKIMVLDDELFNKLAPYLTVQ